MPSFSSLCSLLPRVVLRALTMRRRGNRGMLVAMREQKKKPLQVHAVGKKLRRLKKVVPGCRDAGLEALLRRTAEYMLFLELKVIVLKKILDLHGV
ncbi:hypothetical protein Cni_G17356 [Canna indica]|uniref:BHLH domain-containing protein n=1 Tax=Canna indica TaxID=4628 RepID=A0AAQ3KKI0_9LILI|nr:hypothetical protein Cni_G17356 [Canna indica]